MREVVREQVTVDVPPSAAWDHLSRLEEWPSWAGHIRRMEPDPVGELTGSTEVMLSMRAGPRTRMVVTDYDPPRSWVWEGTSYGVTTRFEHRFEELDAGETRIWFLASTSGRLAGVVGWMFGKLMHRNLARVLPRLKAEMETTA